MELLFFNLAGSFDEVAQKVFSALGAPEILEGDSLNALGGVYCEMSVFGASIRLEGNAYDYEDDYGYILLIDEEPTSELNVDPAVIAALGLIVARMLTSNLSIAVACESPEGLRTFRADEKDGYD